MNGRGPAAQDQTKRPFPQFGNVTSISPSWGNSTYHSLNVKVEKRFSHGLNMLGNYTWAKFLDDVEGSSELGGGNGSGYQHMDARGLDKAMSGSDIRHRFAYSSLYELPFGKGRRWDIEQQGPGPHRGRMDRWAGFSKPAPGRRTGRPRAPTG